MKGNAKVLEFLNSALKHELTAVSQYWLHYRLMDDWGLTLIAKKEREELIQEMHHADKLIARIIFLEGHPNLQTLAPLRIGQNVKEVLECDLAAEYDARKLYTEARDVCEGVKDYTSMNLFDYFLKDEEHHIDFIETQLQLFNTIGDQHYAQLNAASANEAEK